MSSTITYTPLGATGFYTVAQLNTLFTNLAAVINGKMDLDEYTADIVVVETADVAVGSVPVVVDIGENLLTDDVGFNLQPIINLDDGTNAQDAVTVGQVKRALGII